jgi:integrase
MLEASRLGETAEKIRHERGGTTWMVPKRRSVASDFDFYDGPPQIWARITAKTWPYVTHSAAARAKPENVEEAIRHALERQRGFEARDLALLSCLYLGTFRASEICRVTASAGYNAGTKPSITGGQFEVIEPFLKLRNTITLKRLKYVKESKIWIPITDFSDKKYRVRGEINFPLEGPLSRFGKAILKHVNTLDAGDEVFPFNRQRAHQVVNYITGWPPHAFRSQGLKLYSRLLDRNLKDLKEFSGHARLEALVDYLGEGQLEAKLLEGPREP